ncbi:MAG: hypothetical protein ACREOL_06825, partial [Candidatus Dormibacteria bacterium]
MEATAETAMTGHLTTLARAIYCEISGEPESSAPPTDRTSGPWLAAVVAAGLLMVADANANREDSGAGNSRWIRNPSA